MNSLSRKPIAVLVAALCAPVPTWADISVHFDETATMVTVGETFALNIIADIPATEPIVGWGLDLTIDNGLIASLAGSPSIGADWMGVGGADGDGLTGIFNPILNPFGNVSGDGIVLATLTFTADQAGQTDLFLGTTAGDLTEGFALDPTGFGDISFASSHVTVVPIPAPGALPLAAFGLLVVCQLKRTLACA